MITKTCAWDPQLVIPATFEQCLTYEKQILYLQKYIKAQGEKIVELDKRVKKLEKTT